MLRFCSLGSGSSGNATLVEASSGITTTRMLVDCGFTVEDRDRAQGVYFVRYVDPAQAGKDEPGFMSRLFSFGKKKDEDGGPVRYRVQVKSQGDQSTVSVLTGKGEPENGEAGKRIIGLLVDDLK